MNKVTNNCFPNKESRIDPHPIRWKKTGEVSFLWLHLPTQNTKYQIHDKERPDNNHTDEVHPGIKHSLGIVDLKQRTGMMKCSENQCAVRRETGSFLKKYNDLQFVYLH